MSSFPSVAGAVLQVSRSAKTILNRPSEAVTAAGSTPDLDCPTDRFVAVVDVTVLAAGGSITFHLEHRGTDGVWFPLHSLPAITAVGIAQAHVGPGSPVNVVPSGTIRLRWTVVGSATFSASIVGR